MNPILLAAAFIAINDGGIDFTLEGEVSQIDPGRSLFLDATLRAPKGSPAMPPDLRERARGFLLAEDDAEEPVVEKDGRVRQTVHWRLVPEPCAKAYKIAPFAVGDRVAGPVYFDPPPALEPAAGDMEIDPRKVVPPLSWKLVGRAAAFLAAAVLALAGAWLGLKAIARRVKEHGMSPIERAWVELDRLLKKGLPGRGRYKDFYVELTQLVRRYVQRKYGLKAPHMTTEEFLGAFREGTSESIASLRQFLQSADMVKFAGVEATPEMADEATESARSYLKGDAARAASAPGQTATKA